MADAIDPSGPALDRRKVVMGLLFAGSAGAVYARQPREPIDYLGSTKLEQLIPKRIGEWEFATSSGLVVPPEECMRDEWTEADTSRRVRWTSLRWSVLNLAVITICDHCVRS